MQCRYVAAIGFGGALLGGSLAGCAGAHGQTPAAHEAASSAVPDNSSALNPSATAALDGYRASWRAINDATNAGDYQLPELSDHLAENEYLQVSENLYLYGTKGIVSKGTIVLHPHVNAEHLTAKPPTVTIIDCVDDRNDLLYYKSTGKPIDDKPGGFRRDSTVMSELNGIWMATSDELSADGTCTPT